jgi:RNA polymerase sigma-70 factor, ECF subfamily
MQDQLSRFQTTAAIGESFDDVVLPHLGVAYRLARWLMRNEHDAQDVVQEASLRAFRYFRTFTGGDGRAWFLKIVRNTCSGYRGRRNDAVTDSFDEQHHRADGAATDPETLLLQSDDSTLVARAMSTLPDRSHQLIVLRELEGLTYRELADVMGMPMGTVMSGLSRARHALRAALQDELTRSSVPPKTRSRELEEDAVLV